MKKFVKIAGILALVVMVLAVVGATVAFAQGPDDPQTPYGGSYGFRGRGPHNAERPGLGLMAVDQEEMHAAIAEALGISVTELESALDEGTPLFVLADELGVDFDVVRQAMNAVHAEALQNAVDEGQISQEQADWMLSRRAQMGAFGSGTGPGYGMRGSARGWGGGPRGGAGQGNYGAGFQGNCPYAQTQ